MLSIHPATVNDASVLKALIYELAEYERQRNLVVITEADLVRDGFGPQPKFRALIAGEVWLDNRMTAEVIDAFKKSAQAGQRREKPLLSDREMEIVQLVAQGFRNREIGEKLFITEQTVKNHLHNIFDKLGVSDRLELALYAIHHRLIEQA